MRCTRHRCPNRIFWACVGIANDRLYPSSIDRSILGAVESVGNPEGYPSESTAHILSTGKKGTSNGAAGFSRASRLPAGLLSDEDTRPFWLTQNVAFPWTTLRDAHRLHSPYQKHPLFLTPVSCQWGLPGYPPGAEAFAGIRLKCLGQAGGLAKEVGFGFRFRL
jgi:hypothetical protein